MNKRPRDDHSSSFASAPKRQYGAGTPPVATSPFLPRPHQSPRPASWARRGGKYRGPVGRLTRGWGFGWQAAGMAGSRGARRSGAARGGWRTTTARGPTRRSRSARAAPSSTSRSSTTGWVSDPQFN